MDSHKPLTAAEIEELKALLDADPDMPVGQDTVRALLSKLTPPPDAAVREAVEAAERYAMPNIAFQELISTPHLSSKHLSTLLRAVQAPRLTEEQREFLMHIEDCLATTNAMWPKEKKSLWHCLRAAFPEVFGVQHG